MVAHVHRLDGRFDERGVAHREPVLRAVVLDVQEPGRARHREVRATVGERGGVRVGARADDDAGSEDEFGVAVGEGDADAARGGEDCVVAHFCNLAMSNTRNSRRTASGPEFMSPRLGRCRG